MAREAAAALPPELADEALALRAFALMGVPFGALDPAEIAADPVPRRSSRATIGEKRMAPIAALEWTQSGGHVDEVVAAGRSARWRAASCSDRDPNLLTLAAMLPMIVGDRDEALQLFDFAMLDAHRRGSLFAVTGMYLWRGFTLFWRGDLIDAEEELRACLRPGRDLGLRPGHAAVERRPPLLVPDRARQPARGAPGAHPRARARRPRPTARATGATPGSSCWSPRAATRTRSRPPTSTRDRFARYHNPAAARWSGAEGGRARRARASSARRSSSPPRSSTARATGARRARSRARCACSGCSRAPRASSASRRRSSSSARRPSRLELAKSLAALGVTRRLAGRPDYAREPLARAHELAEVCGAERLLADIRTEMLAVGVEPAAACPAA